MIYRSFRICLTWLFLLTIILTACRPVASSSAEAPTPDVVATRTNPPVETQAPDATATSTEIASEFEAVNNLRPLTFPQDFGAHEDFRIEWWYYTGNLDTPERRHFGFELTIFRVGLVSPTVELPADSQWYGRSVYFAHFTVSDIANERFYAFERYSRPGPGLAGAQADPYRVWIDDWNVTAQTAGVYHLQAAQAGIAVDLTLTDETGIILHGENGYSRKGEDPDNASYYYSQPRLGADGFIQVEGAEYAVSGLAWKDHEFSSSMLDEDQIGWDWFSLQFEDGSALMLFQLRERDGAISDSSSGTFIMPDATTRHIEKTDFEIAVLDEWHSPHTQGLYPAAWEIKLNQPNCLLEIHPWMVDQEVHFSTVTYWEGAVRFEGTCDGVPIRGNGYIELTGYAGNMPLP
ncbi:MAG: lipocalin-like domain-containing protein [Chloroflexota bacterium]